MLARSAHGIVVVAAAVSAGACAHVETAPPPLACDFALAAAMSPCGRYRLCLDHAEWSEPEHGRPHLMLQMTLHTGDDDAFVCGDARVTDLVSAAGVEWREQGLGGHARADSRWGGVVFHDLEQYERADSVRRLRVECHVLRVFSWRTYDFTVDAPDASQELICPPYHVGVGGDATTFSASAYCTDDLRTFPAPQRDLFGLLGHDWVASSADLHDATGAPLTTWGAHGSGGFTAAMYGTDRSLDGDAAPIRYPVRGTLRLPDRYVVEEVAFELTDAPLVRE